MVLWIFGDFGLRNRFQERSVSNSLGLQIDQDKLHIKLSALNVDFNDSTLDLLGSRKPAHEGIKERYPRA